MAWVPSYTLWSADGMTLIYTFFAVQDCNVPQSPQDTVVKTNFRSSGAVVISGGNKPFEARINFWLVGDSYADVIAAIDLLISTVPVNTAFLLRVDKSPSTFYQYNVKRVQDFEWLNQNRDWRNYRQEVNCPLLANAW